VDHETDDLFTISSRCACLASTGVRG